MPASWVISVATDQVRPDASGGGEVVFTVTNTGNEPASATLTAVPDGGATPDWFTVATPQRMVMPGTSASFPVRIAVPPGTAAGQYGVTGQVDAPGMASVTSARVGVAVTGAAPVAGGDTTAVLGSAVGGGGGVGTATVATPTPTPTPTPITTAGGVNGAASTTVATPPPPTSSGGGKRPAWLIPAIAGVVILAIVAVVLVAIVPGGTEKVAMPDLISETEEQSAADLEALGLELGEVTYRQTAGAAPAGAVAVMSVDGEPVDALDEVDEGAVVDLTIDIDYPAPVGLEALRSSADPPTHLALIWEEVPHAAGYVITVEQQSCDQVIDILPTEPERGIADMLLPDRLIDSITDDIFSTEVDDIFVLPELLVPVFPTCSWAVLSDIGGEVAAPPFEIDFVPGVNSTYGQFTVAAVDSSGEGIGATSAPSGFHAA